MRLSKNPADPSHAPARRAGVLCALVVAVLSILYPQPASAASATLLDAPPRNYVKNSAFDGVEFWILNGEDTGYVTVGGRSGDGGVRLLSRDAYDAELIQTVGPTLEPGRRYTVTTWVRAVTEGAIAVVGVRWEGGHPRVFRGVDPEDGWVKIEFRFEAPTEPGWRQIVLSGTGELVWDDVGLYEADTLEARLARDWEARLGTGKPIYTGLVVNAQGTDLERGMSPSIYDEDGQLLFAGMGAGDSQLITYGLVAYATDLRRGTSHPRLEVSDAYPLRLPLVVDAQGTRGLPRTDVVIGAADARLIRAATAQYDFLGRFAILFVVEPFAGL